MQLSDKEQRFLAKRAKLVQIWPYVGAVLLAMLIGFGMWLFWSKPLLANPLVVVTRLKSDSITESTIALMAGMLPVVCLMCIGLAITIVLFAFATFSNEKKYLTIIQRVSSISGERAECMGESNAGITGGIRHRGGPRAGTIRERIGSENQV